MVYFLRDFYTCVNWSSFTAVCVTANLLRSLLRTSIFLTPAWGYYLSLILIGGKLHQVSRTHLCILINLIDTVVFMVSDRPHISDFSNHLSKPLGTVTSVQFKTGIIVPLMIYNFFCFLGKSKFLSPFFGIFDFCTSRQQSPLYDKFLFFFLSFFVVVNYHYVLSSGCD